MPTTSGSGLNSIRSFDGLSYEEGAHDQGVFIPCFASGTLIATPQGPRLVEDIRAGDRLLLRGGLTEPVLWAGSYRVRFGPKTLNHLPVQIKRGAMGWGLPQRDLVVSPQHRILLGGAAAGTGPGPLMAKAKSLLPMPGVRRMCGKSSITYHTLLLPQHSVIYAEGLPAESFYPGPYAMRALPEQIRRQIEAALCGRADYGPLAAPELGRREGEMLARNGLASTVLPQGREGCLSGLLPAKAASAQTDHAKSQP